MIETHSTPSSRFRRVVLAPTRSSRCDLVVASECAITTKLLGRREEDAKG
jgi:hypothetical protein